MLRATRPNVSRVRQRSRWGHASRVSNLQGRSVAQEGAENGAEPKMAHEFVRLRLGAVPRAAQWRAFFGAV
eukprot:CAMPEP_0203780902 /NCGR_PEP_ID=MMETSP0099_2-20121227/9810_1 /ASSEMBLY_ACC=CAM_ASM_000209 /TAXON_ID=96639 /ORGANISM=" , Strain NY0313808BC1" /LENGTH=70 /DNA_ID=CAMNT_0050681573 /DNA_START=225 /DNA_END=437 /DNA_ORIENTATION=+